MHPEKLNEVEACSRKIERAKAQHFERWEAAVEEARMLYNKILSPKDEKGAGIELKNLEMLINEFEEEHRRGHDVSPRDVFYFLGRVQRARQQCGEHWEAAVEEVREPLNNPFAA